MRKASSTARWRCWGTAVGAVAVVAMFMVSPAGIYGQGRGPGDRGRGPGEGPGPRREDPPPRRDETPPPRREDSNPPTRREDNNPPRVRENNPPPVREVTPPRERREERREEIRTTPRRDEGAPPVRRDPPPVRIDRGRDDPQPGSGPRIETGPRREDRGSPFDRRGPGGIDRGNRDERVRTDPNTGGSPGQDRAPRVGDQNRGPDRRNDSQPPTDAGPRRDERGPGNVFDRRGPARDSSPNRDEVRRESGPSRDGVWRDARPNRDDSRIERRTDGRQPTRDARGGRIDPTPQRDQALGIFTRSREGRRYQSGIALRPSLYVAEPRLRAYFRDSYACYPYYYPTYDAQVVYYSPYSYYYGVCPPYIYRRQTWYLPPRVIYVEVPVYVRDEARGYEGDLDDYYLESGRYRYYDADDVRDASLDRALDDIRSAFRWGEIERLVYLTDPQVRVSVFLRGKYEYSVSADDYLDMTRDAMRSTDTQSFDLYRIRRRAPGVYVASGRHVYRDQDGARRTVFVSFVLERVYGRWTITQVGTAPDRIREW